MLYDEPAHAAYGFRHLPVVENRVLRLQNIQPSKLNLPHTPLPASQRSEQISGNMGPLMPEIDQESEFGGRNLLIPVLSVQSHKSHNIPTIMVKLRYKMIILLLISSGLFTTSVRFSTISRVPR